MNESIFKESKKKFDKRGIFLIVTNEKIHIWIGSEISQKNKNDFLEYADYYIKKLQKYENAPSVIVEQHDQNESQEFLNIWIKEENGKLENHELSSIIPEWNKWYNEVI